MTGSTVAINSNTSFLHSFFSTTNRFNCSPYCIPCPQQHRMRAITTTGLNPNQAACFPISLSLGRRVLRALPPWLGSATPAPERNTHLPHAVHQKETRTSHTPCNASSSTTYTSPSRETSVTGPELRACVTVLRARGALQRDASESASALQRAQVRSRVMDRVYCHSLSRP
jgi:hypothetical protein